MKYCWVIITLLLSGCGRNPSNDGLANYYERESQKCTQYAMSRVDFDRAIKDCESEKGLDDIEEEYTRR